MDADVIAAMARWPDVPSVYGWLSLTESGHWRLHPDGNAVHQPESPGEAISSPQILAFIDRNYDVDPLGRWYFQNGPQRVYVRLDAAPYIAHLTTDPAKGGLKLRTHTGLDIRSVSAWYIDGSGRLHASTDRGPALISGRDLPLIIDHFLPADHAGAGAPSPGHETLPAPEDAAELLARCMEAGIPVEVCSRGIEGISRDPLPVIPSTADDIADELGFIRLPKADQE